MNNTVSQKEKSELLEQAALNDTPAELAEVYRGLGFVEMSAPALGAACRYCGLETVRALVGGGATFWYLPSERIERDFHCYSGLKDDNYKTDYSLYLLKIFRGQYKGACCLKGMRLLKSAARENKKPLPFLPDEERIAILRFLFENREKIAFNPEEMLFHAYFSRDTVIAEELKRLGVTLSEVRKKYAVEGGASSDGYWYEWCAVTGGLAAEDFLPVMREISQEIGGEKFHLTEWLFERNREKLFTAENFTFFMENFKQEKMNKSKLLREIIERDSAPCLAVIEKYEWFKQPKKRDELIELASNSGKTECTAWLLDFKNRTADFAAEREKAEKKLLRELNADPNSITELKRNWGFKKKEDGTLVITSYKGKSTTIVVPEKIGGDKVTEIGSWALSPFAPMIKQPTRDFRRTIIKITLPEGLKRIGASAFNGLTLLQSVNIPATVISIGEYAFLDCNTLQRIIVPEGVRDIDANAFAVHRGTGELEYVELPSTLRYFQRDWNWRRVYLFNAKSCPKLVVGVPRNVLRRCVEEFCEHNKVKFVYKGDAK